MHVGYEKLERFVSCDELYLKKNDIWKQRKLQRKIYITMADIR